MRNLRLIAWNCQHGSLTTRLSKLAQFAPDIVFLQECRPTATLSLVGQFITHTVNDHKGIALGSLRAEYHVRPLEPPTKAGKATLAVAVEGPVSFTALGVCSQAPRYVDDVIQTLDAYADILRAGPAVVMGDFNSGTDLREPSCSAGHSRICATLKDLGLVSAYHAIHRVEHGSEKHATYYHRRKVSQRWHIDFCFVPDSWVESLTAVEVIDGEEWRSASDHHPLKVDVALSAATK